MPFPVLDPVVDREDETDEIEAIQVSVQHLAPLEPLPQVVQNAVHQVRLSDFVHTLVQQLEHSGCISCRLVGIHAVVRATDEPSDAITLRPPYLGEPERLCADVPTSLQAEVEIKDDNMDPADAAPSDRG